jgi:hypothetical protein
LIWRNARPGIFNGNGYGVALPHGGNHYLALWLHKFAGVI